MVMRAKVLAGVRKAFSKLGDIVRTISYRSIDDTASYNPVTGAIAQGDAAGSPYAVQAVVLNDKDSLINISIDQNIELTSNRKIDKKVIIIQDDLVVTPKENDLIVIDSVTFKIDSFKEDPAQAVWFFNLIAGI